MSENEAELITKQFEKWDQKHAKHNFIERMERKMFKKDRPYHYRTNS